MDKKKLSLEEYKDLFNKYDLYTLDSIGLLMGQSKKMNATAYSAYSVVYNKKYEENIEEFEGRNEYDDLNVLLNFDISEVIDKIDSLSIKQLDYIRNLVDNSLMIIKKQKGFEERITSNLEMFMDKYTEKLLAKPVISTEEDTYTDFEIYRFLRKFNINELSSLGTVLKYETEYDLTDLAKCFKEVQMEKEEKCRSNFEVPIPTNEVGIRLLKYKLKSLNMKELKLLETFTNDAYMYLDSINSMEFSDNEEAICVSGDDMISLAGLESDIFREIANREQKDNKLTYKPNNE